MGRKDFVRAGLRLVAIGLSLAGCSRCEDTDDESMIRQLIDRGADFAEQKALGSLLGLTTEDFLAEPGRHDRRTVKGPLLMAFRHWGTFSIEYPRPLVQIEPSGDRASAQLPFLILRQGDPLPGLKALYDAPDDWLAQARKAAGLYHLKLSLIKDRGEWLVREARIQGTGGFERF